MSCGKRLLFVLCFCLGCVPLRLSAQTTAAPSSPGDLAYVIQPVFAAHGLLLEIDLAYTGNGEGSDTLHLPSRFAGQRHLEAGLQNLHVLSPGTVLTGTAAPQIWSVKYSPGQQVHLHYQLHQDWDGVLNGPQAYFRPILSSTYFHFLGAGVLAYPGASMEPRQVSLTWKNWPSGWTLADSFGTGLTQQFTASPYQFQEAVYVGGDFRLLPLTVRGKPVTIAIRGKWRFHDAEFGALAAQVLTLERAFWQDDQFPSYLITLLPLDSADIAAADSGGVELTNSVALFQPQSETLSYKVKYVLAHEMFHTWNADKIAVEDPASYWFSEGLTAYYSRLLLLQGGLISLDDYVREYNKVVHDYFFSPVRNTPQGEVGRSFFTDTQIQQLPYWQGALLAGNWNAALRRATQNRFSLDDVLREMLAATRASGETISIAAFAERIRHYGGPDITGDLTHALQAGETITPDPCALGPGFTLETRSIPRFDLGCDRTALLQDDKITGVKENSAAYQAGLRDGQKVTECSRINFDDPTQLLTMTVQGWDGEHRVFYSPAGERLSIPQYIAVKNASRSLDWFRPPTPGS